MKALAATLVFAVGLAFLLIGQASATDIILGDGDLGDLLQLQISKTSSNPAAHKIKFSAKDTDVVFTPGGGATDNPPTNGAAAVVFSDTDCQCLDLAPAPTVLPGWRQSPASGTPTKYKWKDDVTKSTAQVAAGKIKLQKKGGITYGLDATPQGEVEVQIRFGDSADTFCSRFLPPLANNDTPTKYKAKIHPGGFAACSTVPQHCPCALPPPTTTTTTSTPTTTTTTTTVCDLAVWAGDYSGTYTGDENGTWTGTVHADGSVEAQATSPTCGLFTGTGTISACGDFEGGLTTGSGICAGFSIAWNGTFTLDGEDVTASGTWSSSSGFSGTWMGSRN